MSSNMTIEEKISMRLKEKNNEFEKQKKPARNPINQNKNKKKVVNKKSHEKNSREPNKLCKGPCDDDCEVKNSAKKELNREFFEKENKNNNREEGPNIIYKNAKNKDTKEKNREDGEYQVVGVIFEAVKKKYYFEVLDDNNYEVGDRVIVDTARGIEIGLVYVKPKYMSKKSLVFPLKPIIRKATKRDNDKFNLLKKEAQKAYYIGNKMIKKNKLSLKLVTTEFTFDKSKLIFYFTAEGRIDFRNLVKDLATIFKLRIELRQIGVRDEARILGNVGICGKELCCKIYINKFDSVLIKMARDQGLIINPAKISGACGRLLCCIKYEYQQYSEALLKCPSMGQKIQHENSIGKVVGINPLNEYVYVNLEGTGRIKLNLNEITFDKKDTKHGHFKKNKKQIN